MSLSPFTPDFFFFFSKEKHENQGKIWNLNCKVLSTITALRKNYQRGFIWVAELPHRIWQVFVIGSHFQNECKCKTFLEKMSFICMKIKNHVHISGFAISLVLKQRRDWGNSEMAYSVTLTCRSHWGVKELKTITLVFSPKLVYIM